MRGPLFLLPLLLVLACAAQAAGDGESTWALLEPPEEVEGVVLGPYAADRDDLLQDVWWPWEPSDAGEMEEEGEWPNESPRETLAPFLPDDGKARRATLARLATDALRRIVVDVEIEGEAGRRTAGRIVTRPGHGAWLSTVRTARVVSTYSAEIACDNSGGKRPSAIGDPVVLTLLEGVALHLRPFVVDGGGTVAIDAVVQAGRFDRPLETLATGARFLGGIDLPVWRGAQARFAGACRVGGVLETDLHLAGRDLCVRLRPRLEGGTRADGGGAIRDHDLDLLLHAFPGAGVRSTQRSGLLAAEWLLPPERPALGEAAVEALVSSLGGDALLLSRGGRGGWIAADDDAHAAIAGRLAARRRAAARTWTVDLEVRAGGVLLGSASVPGLAGRTSFARLGVERAVLPDPDVEVG